MDAGFGDRGSARKRWNGTRFKSGPRSDQEGERMWELKRHFVNDKGYR
jgi:hypothetical protein